MKLSIEQQRRIDEDIEQLADTLGEIYGDASEVEVLVGLAVSASLEHGMDRQALLVLFERAHANVSYFRARLEAFEALPDEDEPTEPIAKELLS
jgi:hypothetical protein